MTYKEKYMLDHPGRDIGLVVSGSCPSDKKGGPCPYVNDVSISCGDCWGREIPDSDSPIKDSGARREFETGAVRDIQKGKGRCDLMPIRVIGGFLYKQYDRDSVVLWEIPKFISDGKNVEHLHRALDGFCKEAYENDVETMLLEVSKQFEDGAKKYGEYNWQKGIPTHCYIDSAVRHYLKWLRGDKDEPHDRAFVWNILCCIWTVENKPELNDYAKPKDAK